MQVGLRQKLAEASEDKGWTVHIPPMAYCTDNAAMIAAVGWRCSGTAVWTLAERSVTGCRARQPRRQTANGSEKITVLRQRSCMTMRASWWCSSTCLGDLHARVVVDRMDLLSQSTAVVTNDDVQHPGAGASGRRDADFDGMRSLNGTELVPNRILDGRCVTNDGMRVSNHARCSQWTFH